MLFQKKVSKDISKNAQNSAEDGSTSGIQNVSESVESSLEPNLINKYGTSRVQRIHLNMNCMTKLVCYFLDSTLPIFNDMNLLLQRDAPCIHRLYKYTFRLLTDLYVRFIKPETIAKAKNLFCLNHEKREPKNS